MPIEQNFAQMFQVQDRAPPDRGKRGPENVLQRQAVQADSAAQLGIVAVRSRREIEIGRPKGLDGNFEN